MDGTVAFAAGDRGVISPSNVVQSGDDSAVVGIIESFTHHQIVRTGLVTRRIISAEREDILVVAYDNVADSVNDSIGIARTINNLQVHAGEQQTVEPVDVRIARDAAETALQFRDIRFNKSQVPAAGTRRTLWSYGTNRSNGSYHSLNTLSSICSIRTINSVDSRRSGQPNRPDQSLCAIGSIRSVRSIGSCRTGQTNRSNQSLCAIGSGRSGQTYRSDQSLWSSGSNRTNRPYRSLCAIGAIGSISSIRSRGTLRSSWTRIALRAGSQLDIIQLSLKTRDNILELRDVTFQFFYRSISFFIIIVIVVVLAIFLGVRDAGPFGIVNDKPASHLNK